MQRLIPLSEERTVDNQIQFLQFAVVDTQEVTRYLDTKASFVLIILGAIWTTSLPFLPDFKTPGLAAWMLRINFILFVISLLYGSYLAIRCVALMPNAYKHIVLDDLLPEDKKLIDQNLFFIPNNRSGMLGSHLNDFIFSIRKLDEDAIVKVMAFEFHKLSYLRNVKSERLRRCFGWMYFLLLHFLVFLGTHYYLTQGNSLKNIL